MTIAKGVGAVLMAGILSASVWAQPTPPAPTLEEQLKTHRVTLREGYARQRPRLLFGPDDKAALQAKSRAHPELWSPVVRSAAALRAVPTPEQARVGTTYWRIERVQSGALVWYLTGDETARRKAIEWMLLHCREPVWGTEFRPNIDLQAAWYLYHIAIAYDVLHPALSAEERNAIRDGLAAHARAIYDSFDASETKQQVRYDQNHTYIPATALAAAALALVGEIPEADDWLRRSHAILERCRYVQPEDGYYYEGFGYWAYALHWHVRYAQLMERATGQRMHDLPVLKENWRFALHMQLPTSPGGFDVGDGSSYSPDKPRADLQLPNYGMLWGLAGALRSPELQLAGNNWAAVTRANDYPAATFLWFDPSVTPAKIDDVPPFQYFDDMDVVTWRSGWDEQATAYHFRCGPPLGHKAADKLKQLNDWTMNAGHVHPDIGAFVMHARGAHLAVTTGYTAEKWTKDHNTLLVNGKGQAIDGAYHNERGYPYDKLNDCRIEAARLRPEFGYVRGTFGAAYKDSPGVDLKRTLVMTKDWLLVVDEATSKEPVTLTWLCHSDAPFEPKQGGVDAAPVAYIANGEKTSLTVVPLSSVDLTYAAGPTIVIAGTAPGKGTPTQRGHNLTATMTTPQSNARLIHLLIPADRNAATPVAKATVDQNVLTLDIEQDGKTQTVTVDLAWDGMQAGEPVKGVTH